MGNEPDGTGTRDNLEVIRELLRRLEEAAHTRSLASSDSPQNANRELASLQQRAPPTRLAPSSPPGRRDYYSSLVALRVDPAARWRLPIVAIGAYALGVATTLATVTYYDDLSRFAGELFAFVRPQPAKRVALAPPPLGHARPEAVMAKDTAPRPVSQPQAPASPTTSAQPGKPQPSAPTTTPSDTSSPPAVPATAGQPAAPRPPAPEEPKSSADIDKKAATSNAVARADPGTRTVPTDTVPPPFTLKLVSRVEVRGGERAPFPVMLEPLPTDAEAMLLVLRGVPEEMALSQGSAIGNEIWLIPAHMARDLEFTVANTLSGTFDLSAELVAIDGRLLAQARTELVAAPPVLPTPAPPGLVATQQIDAETLRRLTARGELLLDTGDIGAARLVLERAAEAGSAIAALRLGETYDPLYLQRMGAKVDAGDETKAQRWYEQAERLGSPRAAERLGELRKR
jgi:hypothetical protein